MQTNIMALNIDFDTKGDYLQGKTKKDILKILVDYYEKKRTLKDIARDIEEDIQSSRLRKHFPKVKTTLTCMYDGTPLYKQLPNKQTYQKQGLDTAVPYCLECGHQHLEMCECEHCVRDQREKIKKAYPQQAEKLIEGCSLFEKVVLATVLQGMFVNNINNRFGSFEDYDDNYHPLFIDSADASRKLQHLFSKGIISVSSDSNMSAFVRDRTFPQRMYPNLVYWQLNVSSACVKDRDELFQSLKYPSGSILYEAKAFNELWRDIIKQELYRCVCMELKNYHFSFRHTNDREKIENQITRLLEVYNPGQVYALFWTAVRRADNSRTSRTWGNYAYNHINFVLKKVDDIEQKKNKENDPIDTFNYPTELSIMLFTKVFFQNIAQEPNWFYRKVPKTKQISFLEDRSQFYTGVSKREKQVFEELDLEVVYYYVTSYGVVVYDGDVDWLFTDEKTLYRIAEKVGFYEFVVSQDVFYSNLQMPYYINDMYSTGYLIELIHFLMKSQYRYHLPEKDNKFKNKLEKLLSKDS
ncbi:hypothetical protein ADIAL_0021 [Alkalibacterium sp. AK22]|uniref:hypothetical protein n=1 Tax=Alkalibacterium sp. AK22 TaxID=1229520 RepID=UPI00044F1CF0|nr:hypothetical protein [Alkalibacterium sp. AK22]EXJ24506.1 hypothetical protein ADIAL_0021 [Alkalibacterium sp. AK22]